MSAYINGLLATGGVVFTAEQAERALGVSHGALLDAAEQMQHKGMLLSPRQGFYVVVPPQYAAWGAPPPTWYIDALMRYLGRPYYVGLLKAAQLHGATHQAVMQFQVISNKQIPDIRAGRNLISFYYRKDVMVVKAGIEDRKTDTGVMKVSSAALTALDLLRYPRASGGLDNVVTVLADLGSAIDAEQLKALSLVTEKPVVQRLGYLLEALGYVAVVKPMHVALQERGSVRWTELDRQELFDPDLALPPLARDDRWKVIVRRVPEADQ
ncbi:MAG: type IV toxin-antitoxin system AbiEi family antitoxin [Burkholderiaceae bacterium]|nr:type IV toxin-antitoxin system AbiEi family antitoxin [Burkholderiaceae bacterium]MCD8564731.1 type IV toxin-antitoxin system AbiEi family antitoxin [Burkholderiaceae bacterium]